MEFLSSQGKYISDQLRSLSVSQKTAVGLLLVILLGGLWQMMNWAGQPEWSPLLDQPFTGAQIRQVQAELAVAGVRTRVQGDRILIQGDDDDRQRYQAILAQRGALPRDTSLGYSSLIKDSNVFVSDQEARWRQSRGLETELSQVIRQFRGVRAAHVFIEKPQKRGLGRAASGARASVHVTLDGEDALDKKRVAAIANFVAGAVEGLNVHDVKITDGTQFYQPPDATDHVAGDLLERQRAQESHYTRMIYGQLGYIQGLLVNVRAKLRDQDERMEQRKLGPPMVLKETENTQETQSLARAAGPGVQPNRGRAITDSSPGTSSTKNETVTDMGGDRDQTHTNIVKPAGFVERLTASINIPRSYLEQIYRNQSEGGAGDKPVQQAEIEAVAKVELPKIRAQVRTLLQVTDDSSVAVDWYYDMPAPKEAGEARETAGFMVLAKHYGPHAGLALLALLSLFFVVRIAKRSSAVVASAKMSTEAVGLGGADADGEDLPLLGGGPRAVGEAEAMHSAMVGHEVDEGLVRTQQIVEQIGELVKEDSDSAASIIQGWLQEER